MAGLGGTGGSRKGQSHAGTAGLAAKWEIKGGEMKNKRWGNGKSSVLVPAKKIWAGAGVETGNFGFFGLKKNGKS